LRALILAFALALALAFGAGVPKGFFESFSMNLRVAGARIVRSK
jgi:hypothetical protein